MQPSTNKSFDLTTNQMIAPLIIKEEKLATRCEICHQADLYDPVNNSCGRCKDLENVLIRANKSITVNTNTSTATNSFNAPNTASSVSFSIVSNGNITQYLQQPLVIALNPIQRFLGKVDRAVEEKIAAISKTKKLFLAVVLCLIGLSGAISTVLHSVKSTFAGANKPLSTSNFQSSTVYKQASDKDERSFHSNINSIINVATEADSGIDSGNSIASSKTKWQPIESLLASTPNRRSKAFNDLGLQKKGSYVVAAFSLSCEDCIRLAKELNKLNFPTSDKSKFKVTSKFQLNYESDYQLIAVANASEQEISNWQKEHQLNYPIKVISEATMEGLGIALFPSLIKVVKGKVVGVSQVAGVLYE